MRRRIEFAEAAESDVLEIALRIAADSVDAALRWEASLRTATSKLSAMSRRCPIVSESAFFGREVRRLAHGRYRVLYAVERDRIVILRVRHGARRRLGEEE